MAIAQQEQKQACATSAVGLQCLAAVSIASALLRALSRIVPCGCADAFSEATVDICSSLTVFRLLVTECRTPASFVCVFCSIFCSFEENILIGGLQNRWKYVFNLMRAEYSLILPSRGEKKRTELTHRQFRLNPEAALPPPGGLGIGESKRCCSVWSWCC